jgi:hypothetical protein
MRQWNVDPKLLCRQHLFGEHVEQHMFLGCIKKGISLRGYIKKGLVEVHRIKRRHDELMMEIENRGYNHKSPLEDFHCQVMGHVDYEQNIEELKRRCPNCRERILNDRK